MHLYMSGTSERAGRLTGFRSARSGVMFATNALEAGVDIGDLEVVILDGYPGSRMAFRQMAGRSGRVGPGAVLYLPTLSAGGVPLPVDAFYSNAGNFRELLTGPIEKAVVEAENPYLAPATRTGCRPSSAPPGCRCRRTTPGQRPRTGCCAAKIWPPFTSSSRASGTNWAQGR
ncbi:helicase-related protein [Deinococcus radiophilus]|uniref:helicase-related protein n=1 Tax=Deinococcus radiophilus TaxID=32062 RepID=UPI00361A3163